MVSVLGVASVANGYITASAAAARGIQSRQLSEAVSRGELEKLGRPDILVTAGGVLCFRRKDLK